METREEVLAHYKLSKEEHARIFEVIKALWTKDKHPVERPIAIIVGGQTGAGKTGLIGYSKAMFKDGNVIVINSDEFAAFHPKIDEFAPKYPEYFTNIQGQETATWTSDLFKFARENHYNLIFEGTMWNTRVADDAIADLISLGYSVIVRGMSVGNLESKLSVVDRYINEIKVKGYGRLVEVPHHDRTYDGMPNTIDYIEQNGYYSALEIFSRNSDDPSRPKLIYSSINKKDRRFKKTVSDSAQIEEDFVSTKNNPFTFESAKDAVIGGRRRSNHSVILSGEFRERLRKFRELENFPEIETNLYDLIFHYEKERKKLKTAFKSIQGRFVG